MRWIWLPGPGSGVGFHLDRYPCRPVSAGALSWQHQPAREQTPAKALLPLPVRVSGCLGVEAAPVPAAAALSCSIMRKM